MSSIQTDDGKCKAVQSLKLDGSPEKYAVLCAKAAGHAGLHVSEQHVVEWGQADADED